MFQSNIASGEPPFFKRSVFPTTELWGQNFKTTVIFNNSIQEFLDLTGPAPGNNLTFIDFNLQAAYKVLAADWQAGLVIPLHFKLSGALGDPIVSGLIVDYLNVNYNAAVEAYITTGMRLAKVAFFSGDFGFTVRPNIEIQTGAGFPYTGNVFVSYDYHIKIEPVTSQT